ncbi:hypothetical protein H9Q13_07830 [Pontibacter sp. JH31]|uniref:STAS/SEC14 domain-containing protein n=1 Tax=Pontibacter aquaedesilientis TaxID=2766980 RepID=A0ABR7XFJ6_9BACT|nr:hypothetical protein [Pontibacter aquaedesilientis]MBD1397072.1 hypothetical protein [Pontibacter aquaedesilientis]
MLPKPLFPQTNYSTDFYKIEIDPATGLLLTEWQRPVNKEELIAGGTNLYEALRETGITRVVANAERMSILDASAKEWLSTTFYELLSQTSLQKLARVLPSSLFAKLALEAVATRAEAQSINKFQFKNFSSQREALLWVQE